MQTLKSFDELPATVVCEYCGQDAVLVKGRDIYRGNHRQDYMSADYWFCRPCEAWVGCHRGTTIPLGRLANAALREAKQRAHAAFDPIWLGERNRKMARGIMYHWLARELGISVEDCHIGAFDLETCDRVVSICKTKRPFQDGVL